MRHHDSTKLCARCGKRESLKLATAMETPRRRTYWLCWQCKYFRAFPQLKGMIWDLGRVFRHAPLGI
jgi:transposase